MDFDPIGPYNRRALFPAYCETAAAMISSYVEAITMGLLMAGLMFGLGWTIGAIAVRVVEDPTKVQAIRDTITKRARLETGLESRREKREAELRQLEGELAVQMKRRNHLQQRLTILKNSQDVWVRIVGDESTSLTRFLAQMSNRYITPGQKDHKHALVDSSWAAPQRIEVWASGIGEARSLLEKRFPPSFGFILHSIGAATPSEEPRGK